MVATPWSCTILENAELCRDNSRKKGEDEIEEHEMYIFISYLVYSSLLQYL